MDSGKRELGFLARPLVQANLPYRRVDGCTFQRFAGRLALTFQAPPHIGLPFGRYPRLLLVWVVSEAVKTRSRHLDLGPSLYTFMSSLGVTPSGGAHGPRWRFLDQMKRLFSTSITVTWDGEECFASAGFHITSSTYIWWRPIGEAEVSGVKGRLSLSREFFEGLLEAPVPLDLAIMRELTSSLSLDIYCWLSYRSATLQQPVRLRWDALQVQFGSQVARTRDFRRAFLRELRRVLGHYPARVRARSDWLLLLPGPTGDGRPEG